MKAGIKGHLSSPITLGLALFLFLILGVMISSWATCAWFLVGVAICAIPGWFACRLLYGSENAKRPEFLGHALILGLLLTTFLSVIIAAAGLGLTVPTMLAAALSGALLCLLAGQWAGHPLSTFQDDDPMATRSGITIGLILVLAVVAGPLLNVGREVGESYAYAPHFNRDFFRNVALGAALSKGEIPPANPYFKGEVLHYYWFQMVFPALVYRLSGRRVPLEDIFLLSTLLINVTFVFTLVHLLRRFVKRIPALITVLGLALVAESYQAPFKVVLSLQPTHWALEGTWMGAIMLPPVGYFFQHLLYLPHHFAALVALLIVISLLVEQVPQGRVRRAVAAALILVFSSGFSFFISAFGFVWAASYLALEAIRDVVGLAGEGGGPSPRPSPWEGEGGGPSPQPSPLQGEGARPSPRPSPFQGEGEGPSPKPSPWEGKGGRSSFVALIISGVIIGIAGLVTYGLLTVLEMLPGEANAWRINVNKFHLAAPIHFLVMLGPMFVLGLAGLVMSMRDRKMRSRSFGPVWLLLSALLIIMFVVTVNVPSWEISQKLGVVLRVAALALSGLFLDHMINPRQRRIAWLALLLFCASAIPNLLAYEYVHLNIRDSNLLTYVGASEKKAAAWIRQQTPLDAVVQSWPEGQASVRPYYREGGDAYSLIPVFGERQTAVGDPQFAHYYVPHSKYQEVDARAAEISQLYEEPDRLDVAGVLEKYGIDYLYWGISEKRCCLESLSWYEESPLFEKVYDQDGVSIFRLNPDSE